MFSFSFACYFSRQKMAALEKRRARALAGVRVREGVLRGRRHPLLPPPLPPPLQPCPSLALPPAPLPLCQLSRPRSFAPASTAVTLCVGGQLGRVARRAAQVGAAACAPLRRAALHAVLVRPANAPAPPRRPAHRSPSLPPLVSAVASRCILNCAPSAPAAG